MPDINGWSKTQYGMPEVGAHAERQKDIGMRDIELFTEITGDRNPLHYDEVLARKSKFGGLVVQGGVTSGILNAIVAEDLPGPGSVFLDMTLEFLLPVRIGDTITGQVVVKSVRRDKPICTLDVAVKNQNGEICLRGSATCYTVDLK
ncbi:MaoC family dehydratase [Methylonatrum kenyense]|uniref:MaoC family dehydratase n=1 Tax=Methylonatrum kenyense TaxID=455253 RepID=UPI0020BDC9D1|nr:MaoC family dehydratase [Methylonatrum kenyense]MCK8517191.1 MaoC family dehydratase [Methylonatrum kenyense]